MNGNQITVVGNVTAEPELKHVGKDAIPVVNFSIARSYSVGGDPENRTTEFYNVVVWREMAEHFAASVRKGDRVLVSGMLKHRTWTAADGTNRQTVEIVADEVAPSLRFAVATLMVTAGKRAGEIREPAHVGIQAPVDPAAELEELGQEPF